MGGDQTRTWAPLSWLALEATESENRSTDPELLVATVLHKKMQCCSRTVRLRGVVIQSVMMQGCPNRNRTTSSSSRWLQRQRNDAYSKGSHLSRAYWKLEQVDKKHGLFRRLPKGGSAVIDLGCAPGGWAEYASKKLRLASGDVIAGIDLLPMPVHIAGLEFILGNVTDPEARQNLLVACREVPVRIVLRYSMCFCECTLITKLISLAVGRGWLPFDAWVVA